jgi:hypothetical protein
MRIGITQFNAIKYGSTLWIRIKPSAIFNGGVGYPIAMT